MMSVTFLAAAVQMNSGEDKAHNLGVARRLVEQAAHRGARLIVLPEMFNCLGRRQVMIAEAEEIPGPTMGELGELARRLGVVIVGGSIGQRSPDPLRVYNTAVVIDAGGNLLARYRKLHLFHADIDGAFRAREAEWVAPGDTAVAARTELGTLGLAICYDLRFPRLFGRLSESGADVICLPAAFTAATGRDHWEVLLRARALDTQAYIVAPNQCGRHEGLPATYGRSMIVDPWGTVLATATDGEGLCLAEIDLARVAQVRGALPVLDNTRAIGEALKLGIGERDASE